jgi:translation initiation factor 2B subunit (eIF-2B alpha/beta/delta family)
MDPDTVIQQIKDVEIQGATAVARTGVELLQALAANDASDTEISDVAQRLKAARPTEPFLRNAIDIAHDTGDYEQVLHHIDTARNEINDIGSDLIPDDGAVFTHCHSSTVTSTLVTAFDSGTDMTVHCTETRPLYQGRETARELADAGIAARQYVDAGARIALKQADVMVIGADAITPAGQVLNKIGSDLFAAVAQTNEVPVYVMTDSWKFVGAGDPQLPSRERRDADEVWADAPDGVEIVNYAFERIQPELVDGIVSELGVLAPDPFVHKVQDEYPAITGAVV